MPRGDLLPLRGKVAEPLTMEVVGELTIADLSRLEQAPKSNVPILKKLRAVHHRQAQLLAQGKTLKEVSYAVGCSEQRLVQLQIDPAFKELMHYYQDQIAVQTVEDAQRIQEKLKDIGEMAIDEMQERLEDPEKIQTIGMDQLRKIGEFAMDRTVAPPKSAPPQTSTPPQVTINFGTKVGRPTIDENGKVVDVEEKE